MRVARGILALVALALLAVNPAFARGPVIHTFFEPNPEEDLILGAKVAGGQMPAAVETPSGTVQAPNVERAQDKSEVVYGGLSTPGSADASYRIDSDTSRPELVSYDDPFTPAVTPFKRLFAYDAVEANFELGVNKKELESIPIGGSVASGDDQFYGDVVVDLAEDTAVRVPSVGPGARVLSANTHPQVKFELLRDGADNWFIRSTSRLRVRLVMQLAIPRAVFGSHYADVSFNSLAPHLPALPAATQTAADEVLTRLDISQTRGSRTALQRLVQHFRAFSPSTSRPRATGLGLYKELALDQKGVCRHRAYAFTITAIALGLPTRMVRNEAHAWVEVFDGTLWHRIDLGGAAEEMQTEHAANQPVHRPPEDPFSWPEGSESGQDMASRALTSSQAPGTGAGQASGSTPTPGTTDPNATGAPTASPDGLDSDAGGVETGMSTPDAGAAEVPPEPEDPRPPARVKVTVSAGSARRGEPLPVRGRVEAGGRGCGGVRVDFALKSRSGQIVPVQSLPADLDGNFSGALVIWNSVDVGDYDLIVTSDGNAECGKGHVP